MRTIVLSMLFALLPYLSIGAVGTDLRLEMAQRLYEKANYDSCIQIYESIISKKSYNDDLYYNLGNAYYRKNKVAEAVWCYEKALLINPSNTDARFNLNIVKEKNNQWNTDVDTSLSQRIVRLFTLYTFSTYLWIQSILLVLVLGSVLVFLISSTSKIRKLFFRLSAITLLFYLYFLIGAIASYTKSYNQKQAIIAPMSVNLKSSPDAKGMDINIVYAGNKVAVKDEVNKWYKIRTENDAEGWIKGSNLLMLSSELPLPLLSDNSY